MNKIIIAIVIVLVVVAIAIGAYFFMTMNNTTEPGDNQGQNNAQNYQVQGMQVETLRQGVGAQAKAGDSVTVNYVGTLTDGKKFDSSYDRNAPFTFMVGKGTVIKGWDLGIVGMKVGEKRKLVVPPELAYGANGFPPIIPKSATLTFEVELLKIN